jgi:hypothetical protein
LIVSFHPVVKWTLQHPTHTHTIKIQSLIF